MTTKIRYRCETGSTHLSSKRFHHVKRLGRITQIRAYRFRATRSEVDSSGERHRWSNTFERIMIKGENGTARFDGVCWGFDGTGPRALVQLLTECGIDKEWAETIAFKAKRRDAVGLDWQYTLAEPPDTKEVIVINQPQPR